MAANTGRWFMKVDTEADNLIVRGQSFSLYLIVVTVCCVCMYVVVLSQQIYTQCLVLLIPVPFVAFYVIVWGRKTVL